MLLPITLFLSLIRRKQDTRTTRETAHGTAVTDSYLSAEVVSIPVTKHGPNGMLIIIICVIYSLVFQLSCRVRLSATP